MQRKPRDPQRPILDWQGALTIAILGTYIGLATLGLFHYYLSSEDPSRAALAGTVAFTGIILVEKMNVLNFRSLRSPLRTIGVFSNPWILLAIGSTVGLQVAAVYVPFLQRALHTTPLGWVDWLIMIGVAAPIFIFTEFYKWVRSRSVARSRSSAHP